MGAETMSRFLTLAALTWCVAAPTCSFADAVDQREWLEVKSANFRIYSVLGEERTGELLRHLEIMRATLGDASEAPTYEADIQTVIIAVDNHDDYVDIGAPAYSGGYFFSDLRENAILIEDSRDSAGIQVILHEYAHYLSRKAGRIRFPRWFEEGNAEYLSHARLQNDAYEFALAPKEYIATLGFAHWMPLETVLGVSDASSLGEVDGALFYAQSWLLVHYLKSRASNEDEIRQQLAQYAVHASSGSSPVDAFSRAFDLEVDQLETALLQYYLERQFAERSLPADTALPGFSTRVREMTASEARLALAQMALRFENIDGAEHWFESVLSDNDLRALAEAGLGRVAGHRGDIEAANARFEAAIRLMAWDFSIWMDYAQYWAQRVSTSYSPKDRVRYASRLIDSLEAALTIGEATPELNSLMGFAYLAKGKDPREAIEFLEAAAAEAPHDQASRLLLANAYLYVGRLDDAARVAESVMQFEHEPGLITSAAREVISEVRRRR
jgi:tetratricopeptide (TPR) repeat protein